MLNKEICFRCCLKVTGFFNDAKRTLGFRKSFEVGWEHNLSYCPHMAGWIAPLQDDTIPSKCPYIVEHVVNAE